MPDTKAKDSVPAETPGSGANNNAGKTPAWSGVPVVIPVVVVPVAVPVDENGIPRNFPPKTHVTPASENKNTQSKTAGEPAGENPSSPQHHRQIIQEKLKHSCFASINRETRIQRLLRQAGGTGFIVSLFFHIALAIVALLIVSAGFIQKEPEPEAFVTGTGGGRGGDNPSFSEHALRKRPNVEIPDRVKIASKSPSAAIVLPSIDFKIPTATRSGLAFSSGDGSASGGLGGGIGGGIGGGKGVGVGDSKNFVGKFSAKTILGGNVYANKIAVYLDCSGSMTPYLARVKEEIYYKFPDADIFEFDGVRTEVVDGELVGSRNGKRMKSVRSRPRNVMLDSTDVKKLTPTAQKSYKKYAKNFAAGSVGAWLDVMALERYDALVVFSDFEDGIRQYDKNGKTVFADSAYAPMLTDNRTAKDLKWYKAWESAFSRKDAPKLYLFSISKNPQEFLRNCVELSKGAITDASYLRKNSKTALGAGDTEGDTDDQDDE